MKNIEVRITLHSGTYGKWAYYDYGDRFPSGNAGLKYYYQHAKFKLPSGKPKCLTFGADDTPEQILESIKKKYTNFRDMFSIKGIFHHPQ